MYPAGDSTRSASADTTIERLSNSFPLYSQYEYGYDSGSLKGMTVI